MRNTMIAALTAAGLMFGSAAAAAPQAGPEGSLSPAPGVDPVAISAAMNLVVYALPSGCRAVFLYDLTYFKCAGLWYLPHYQPSGVSYVLQPAGRSVRVMLFAPPYPP